MSDWRHRAACRDQDPETWFPIGTTGPALSWIEDAKAICNGRCPVVDQCLQFALDQNMSEGVWGAMTADERRALKRRMTRTAGHSHNHGPEVRDRAEALFHALRPNHSSNEAALKVVAAKVGIDRVKTVRGWMEDAGLITPAASTIASEERRRAVVARYRAERPSHRSNHAAHLVIAAEFGLHPDTVREWTTAARTLAAGRNSS